MFTNKESNNESLKSGNIPRRGGVGVTVPAYGRSRVREPAGSHQIPS